MVALHTGLLYCSIIHSLASWELCSQHCHKPLDEAPGGCILTQWSIHHTSRLECLSTLLLLSPKVVACGRSKRPEALPEFFFWEGEEEVHVRPVVTVTHYITAHVHIHFNRTRLEPVVGRSSVGCEPCWDEGRHVQVDRGLLPEQLKCIGNCVVCRHYSRTGPESVHGAFGV